MPEARNHHRVNFRLPVNLFKQSATESQVCLSRDIGYGGLYAEGAQAFEQGESLRLVIAPDSGDALHLDGRVVRRSSSGIGCEFVGNSPASMEVLQALLSPTWDGENLLDGVVSFAPWYRDNDLAGWMRLTSLVSDWQRLTGGARF